MPDGAHAVELNEALGAPRRQPFMDVANATVISPMNPGVRVLTGAARTLFPLGRPLLAPRPTGCDSSGLAQRRIGRGGALATCPRALSPPRFD